MKNIVIIGFGKAGNLHLKSYKQISNIGTIYIIDTKKNNINNYQTYSNIMDLIKKNSLNVENLIVDICTPKSTFNHIIKECYDLGIRNILVEKPFIVNQKFFIEYKDLNIVMVQNYLYSEITNKLKKLIKQEDSQVESIYSNFSKNRIIDSLNKRGISDQVTLNYEIEIPHQIYLTNYLLDFNGKTKKILALARDMIIDKIVLPKHGYGLIVSNKNAVTVVLESDLMAKENYKKVVINFANKKSIEANYLLYDKDLNMIKPGNICVFNNGKLIEKIEYYTDDNFYKFIEHSYKYFNSNLIDKKNIEDILSFSDEINLYIQNLIQL